MALSLWPSDQESGSPVEAWCGDSYRMAVMAQSIQKSSQTESMRAHPNATPLLLTVEYLPYPQG